MAAGTAARFQPLRAAIDQSRTVLNRLKITTKPEKEVKQRFLTALRNEADEQLLEWFSAAVLLTDERPQYPPLLGTGGNDGRLDFTNNYLQRLMEIFDATTGTPLDTGSELLSASMYARPVADLSGAAVGQFSPGAAGGPNQGTGFGSDASVNPWDFVFMLEGAVLFAGSVSRRLHEPGPGLLSYPFTVRATGAGAGVTAVADESNAREEIWVPLWRRPATLGELRLLFGEGRATVGRRAARDGLEFSRALARLGVDRGITEFERYAFLMRSGKAYFATPLRRVRVERNPLADLIDDLDRNGWLTRFRRFAREKDQPQRLKALLRRLEDALFGLTEQTGHSADRTQRALIVLGRLHHYAATSSVWQDERRGLPPIPWLSEEWVHAADDGSLEFSLAAAIAGLHALTTGEEGKKRRVMPMREHVAPEITDHYPVWSADDSDLATWSSGSLRANLATVASRRLLESEKRELSDKPFLGIRSAPLEHVAQWLISGADEIRLGKLVLGLGLARVPRGVAGKDRRVTPIPAAYRVLKPLFAPNEQLRRIGWIHQDEELALPMKTVRLLVAGDVREAVRDGQRRLRISGLSVELEAFEAAYAPGPGLLSALLVPIRDSELKWLLPVDPVASENKPKSIIGKE
jgi:CRISPR-associated protein Csx17